VRVQRAIGHWIVGSGSHDHGIIVEICDARDVSRPHVIERAPKDTHTRAFGSRGEQII
jgi:hypothetical protein